MNIYRAVELALENYSGDMPDVEVLDDAVKIIFPSVREYLLFLPDERIFFTSIKQSMRDMLDKIEICSKPPSDTWEKILLGLADDYQPIFLATWAATATQESDGDKLIIRCPSAYAAARLSDSVSDAATKLAGKPVVFVTEEESEDASAQDDYPESVLEADAADDASDEETQKERIISMPAYALRFIHQGEMTPKELSLWVAFRQCLYQDWTNNRKATRALPWWQIAKFANMSRASFFRATRAVPSIAGGMVKRLNGADRRARSAYRYAVRMNPPLTQRDATVLTGILIRATAHSAAKEKDLESTIRDLLAQPVNDFLDAREPLNVSSAARSVSEIVRGIISSEEIPAGLKSAADALQSKIIHSGGTVLFSHYFITDVAPRLRLSHAAMWAILLLRDMAFYDYQNQEQMPYGLLHRGASELAERINVDVRSVRNWLSDPVFTAFVAMRPATDTEIGNDWTGQEQVFSIRLDDPSRDEITALLGKSETTNGKSETTNGKSETTNGKSETTNGKSEHTIKAPLSPIKPQLSPIKIPPANKFAKIETPQASTAPLAGNMGYWDWNFFIQNNRIAKINAKKIEKSYAEHGGRKKMSQDFVSWLLYGFSTGGKISSPVGNAIARMLEIPQGAGGDFDIMADISPARLRIAIQHGSAIAGGGPAAVLLENYFAKTPQTAKNALFAMLYGNGN